MGNKLEPCLLPIVLDSGRHNCLLKHWQAHTHIIAIGKEKASFIASYFCISIFHTLTLSLVLNPIKVKASIKVGDKVISGAIFRNCPMCSYSHSTPTEQHCHYATDVNCEQDKI